MSYRDDMRQFGRDGTWTIGQWFVRIVLPLLLVLAVIGFLTRGFGLLSNKTFAAGEEQVRHDTFKESQAYNDGMKNEINSYYIAYQKATEEERRAIRSVVLHQMGSYDETRLPDHLQAFVRDVRRAQQEVR